MNTQNIDIGPGTIEVLVKSTTKEAYLRKLGRAIGKNNPSRSMLVRIRAADKGFAVHRQMMCGETQSSFFLLHLDDPIAAACGYSILRPDRVAACITGLDKAVKMVSAQDPVAWAKANGGWLWIRERGAA